MSPTVGLVTVATGRYVEFLDGLLASARRYFFPGHRVVTFLFTDATRRVGADVQIAARHEPWPFATLRRYHLYAAHADRLRHTDYLFHIDADMRFEAPCTGILPRQHERLVGVEHPGYYRRPWAGLPPGRLRWEHLPFEKDPRSLACIADRAHRIYYAGGFNGGFTDAFLAMAASLRDAIDHDLSRGIVAVWHDESHLNRYFYVQPPRRLTPAYCYPESGYRHLRHLSPVVVALDKDHARYRETAA